MTEMETQAQDAGRAAGWSHANYVDAYGGAVIPEDIDVPGKFADVETYYIAGFEDGVSRFFEGSDHLSW